MINHVFPGLLGHPCTKDWMIELLTLAASPLSMMSRDIGGSFSIRGRIIDLGGTLLGLSGMLVFCDFAFFVLNGL